jgi:hypothetical protein
MTSINKVRLRRRLEAQGYKVIRTNPNYFYGALIELEYTNKGLPEKIPCGWAPSSLKDLVAKKLCISKDKVDFWLLGEGEPAICTRIYRRTYLIGKSTKSRTRRAAKGVYHIRPMCIDIGCSIPYVIRELKKIISKIGSFNKITLVYRGGLNCMGAYVSAGGRSE